jgi:hypothetical protein
MGQLIEFSADYWCEKQQLLFKQRLTTYQDLLVSGKYAAESLESNPVHHAWVDAAATFQDAMSLENRFFSEAIKKSSLHAIHELVEGVNKQSQEYKDIQDKFGAWMLAMSQIQYHMVEVEPRSGKRFGFYTLHERDLMDGPEMANKSVPVSTKKKFQRFTEKVLDRVFIGSSVLNNVNEHNAPILQAFKKVILDEHFIPTVQAGFQEHVDAPLTSEMDQYPWKFWDSGILPVTYEVCMNTVLEPKNTSVVRPTETMELADWYLTGLYNYCHDNDDWDFKRAPSYMGGSMQGHVFNWLIGDPSTLPLIHYMKENACNAQAAFKALLFPAAKKVYDLKATPSFKQELFTFVRQLIAYKTIKLPEISDIESLTKELELLEKNISMPLNQGALCNEVLIVLNKKFKNPAVRNWLACEMTAFVAKNLDEVNFQAWIAPAILVADSNREDETGGELRSVCFFIAISPVTLKPFLGEINDLKLRTERFNPLPGVSEYYAMHYMALKELPNPSV